MKDFFHKIGSDLSHVHVRAAFHDVEHRVEKFFKHVSSTESEEKPDPE